MHSLAILRLLICVLKILDINLRYKIKSSVPMYLSLGAVSCDRFVTASLPNMTKNGDYFECWFGNKLYDVVASGTTSSHFLYLKMCLARQLLRNLWNPSILPFDYGLYGGEYIFLSTQSCSVTLENKSFLNLVPLSISSFLQTPNRKVM